MLVLVVFSLAPAAAQRVEADEYRVKAAFIARFPQFVTWPEAGEPASTFDLCVMAPSPFGGWLSDAVSGTQIAERPAVIREVTSVRQLDGCKVLFLSPRPLSRRYALLRRARDLPILTVGEDSDFIGDGGIITLRVIGTHLRFDINAGQAQRVDLRISSQLLRLATDVVGGRP